MQISATDEFTQGVDALVYLITEVTGRFESRTRLMCLIATSL
jgi:hypothetical protein